MAGGDEIILSELDDAALVEQMHQDLYDGLKDEVVEGVNMPARTVAWTPDKVLTEAWSPAWTSSASTSATASCSCPKCCWRPTR